MSKTRWPWLDHLRLAVAYWLFQLATRLVPEGEHELEIGGGRFRTEHTVTRERSANTGT